MDRLQEVQPLNNRVVIMLSDDELNLFEIMKAQDGERFTSNFGRRLWLAEARRRGLIESPEPQQQTSN